MNKTHFLNCLRRQHLNQIVRLREPYGFVGFTEQILKPAALMDSLQLRLGQVLTKDQMKRFSRFGRRMSPGEGDDFDVHDLWKG